MYEIDFIKKMIKKESRRTIDRTQKDTYIDVEEFCHFYP